MKIFETLRTVAFIMESSSIFLCILFSSSITNFAANGMIKSYVSQTYDWDSRSSDVSAPCVKIPKNLSLCQGIDYDSMRLPNLLEHDTMAEVSQQAASWIPLLNVRCHPDTQRFICSLFCPVCLEQPIYPCRSLCEKVKSGCEIRMKKYGFPWPHMFTCSLFPEDNDMCVHSSDVTSDASSGSKCEICEPVNTVENILDYYCRSNFAVRGKLKRNHHSVFVFKKTKLFKVDTFSKKELNEEVFQFNISEECCREKLKKDQSTYFIMGKYQHKRLIPTFIMPWVMKRSKSFKKSIRMLKTLNCTNPEPVTQTAAKSDLAMFTIPTLPTYKPNQNNINNQPSTRNKTGTGKRRKHKN